MRDIVMEIRESLKKIEETEQVRILHAVESGSRAWGFASPDSDYDVRFVYVRKPEDYLRLDETKDVIEWQLDDVLDINGWDLKKAMIQFHRSNATLFEWSHSPIVYQTTEEWKQIARQTSSCFSVKRALYHYYGTANSTFLQYLQGEMIKYKKYFYALRPILACWYIQKYECPPPVLFDDLMKQELPDLLRSEIHMLLEKKKQTEEQELNPQIPLIYEFISTELERQKQIADQMQVNQETDWAELNQLFLDVLRKGV